MTPKDFPIVFISYDEPNADTNYEHLCAHASIATHRVHGVKGFDASHQAARKIANANNFITIDGDTRVCSDFWDSQISVDVANTYCWRSINKGNGLAYGNGGVKLWNAYHLDTPSHENDPQLIDFCFQNKYVSMRSVVSETDCFASPVQATRAGFREGLKLLTSAGDTQTSVQLDNTNVNVQKVVDWSSLGCQLENGVYANLGTLLSVYHCHVERETSPGVCISYEDTDTEINRLLQITPTLIKSLRSIEPADLDKRILCLKEDIFSRTGLFIPRYGKQQSASIVRHRYSNQTSSNINEEETWHNFLHSL